MVQNGHYEPTKNRFGVYHVRKVVPDRLRGILNKREIKFTLDAKDASEARMCAPAILWCSRTQLTACCLTRKNSPMVDRDNSFTLLTGVSRRF
ncbi:MULTISPECIES: DUF6538 domain-containing protein [Enterobacteriaceae]|uniref:DUF6538 domain-containing protein n=1 Tax=Enterobacteriaceae TaxID=543 RepID=UPI0035BE4967